MTIVRQSQAPMSIPARDISISSGHSNDAASQSVFRKTLKFLLLMPSRFLPRLLRSDRVLDRGASSPSYGTDGDSPIVHMANPPPFYHPGPWSFFASGYAISLFAMVRHIHSDTVIHSYPTPSGSALEPHPEHRRAKSASTTTSYTAYPQLTKPLASPSPDPTFHLPVRSVIHLLQNSSSIANNVLHPQVAPSLVSSVLASLRPFSPFLLEAFPATRRLGFPQRNG